ncbi:MAG: homoserine dehydrogenase [Desulfuromonas sp.]|nr:MAG: homoserine dehydrogenase [Desulfuromonas sp.]
MQKQINVALLGFGTVGTGVVKILQDNGELLEQRVGANLRLKKVIDLDTTTDRGVVLPDGVLSDNIEDVFDDQEIDVVIELIGGYEPARTFVLRSIAAGKHIVTANKALLALHGEEIFAAAEEQGVSVMYEASVGGGIPIITSLLENLGANRFNAVFGILNGTCNYILTRMTREGSEFATILKDAQQLGYAEADPTFDVEGVDTAHKLALLVQLCFNTRIPFESIYTEGISDISPLDIQFAEQFGYRIKLLAIGKRGEKGIEARVHPTMVPDNYPLAEVHDVFNAVRVVGDYVGPVMLYGQGAGMEATGSAVVGDVMAVARNVLSGTGLRTPSRGISPEHIGDLPICPMEDIVSHYYLRFAALDQPGVLAQISSILGEYNISITSMIQPERKVGKAVPIVIMTHDAREEDINAALKKIDELSVIVDRTRLIRIENELD